VTPLQAQVHKQLCDVGFFVQVISNVADGKNLIDETLENSP
jgi:hypothetical protein